MDGNGILELNKLIERSYKETLIENKDEIKKFYKQYKKLVNCQELTYKRFISIVHKIFSIYIMFDKFHETPEEVIFYYLMKAIGVVKIWIKK